MERLTKYSNETTHENGVCCTHFGSSECCEVGGNCALDCKWEETAWERLVRYEDTGLTPAEVLSMHSEWNAMISVLNSIGSYDRLRELAEADKEGRVVVMPCKVGDTVYFVSKRYKCINELTINSVESIVLLGKKWGKCVFVSREEAERALEEAKRNG